ncbi:hypothetical protein AB3M89_02060 [Microbacterium sp. 179-I 3D2 NHS]|uniref:hypothetical protein n=1 Tax=Microbacterium sp. 179-I 3D2 NHS TaxID=3235178 RepID=UPI0039A3B589
MDSCPDLPFHDAEDDDAAHLSAALAAVPDEYAVNAANADSLGAEVAEGAPLPVLTPTGDGTGVAITEVSAGLPQSVLSLGENRDAVTRDDGTSTVAQQKLDGSVQIITTIESSAAPTEYSFNLTLPEDASLRMNEDGSIVAYSETGAFVAGVHKPSAVDADGDAVPTHFTIDGNRLTQFVAHDDTDAYPIVTDPWLGANLYGSVRAANTSQGYVLTPTPTQWGAAHSGVANISMWWAHADEVKNKVPRGYAWSLSLQEQLYCHIAGWPVSANPSYDLESWKPYTFWEAQIPSKCLGGYSPGS